MTKEETTPRSKKIEVRDMYSLVDKSLLKETNSDQPHYIKIEKAQNFCKEYADQQTKELTEELKRVTKKASILEQDTFKLIEALESAKEDATFLVEEIDTLKAEAKEKDERIKEYRMIAGRSQSYLNAFVSNNLDGFHKENAFELSKKIDKLLLPF